jgi:hypothetical protein
MEKQIETQKLEYNNIEKQKRARPVLQFIQAVQYDAHIEILQHFAEQRTQVGVGVSFVKPLAELPDLKCLHGR